MLGFLLIIFKFMESGRHVVVDERLIGYGNEHGVREVLELDGGKPDARKVAKQANHAFFGWQTPRHANIRLYLDSLAKHGISVRESVELLENPEIEHRRVCTRRELVKSFFGKMSVGFVMKLLSKHWSRGSDYAIVEDYCDEPSLKMNVLDDERLSKMLVELLENGEQMLEEDGLFVDPLGGAAISASFKYLGDPSHEPILSNLREEDGKVVLTDFGLMNVRDTERVYNIPGTAWAMKIALSSLGHLSFEAMNMALRDYGHDLKPRPLKAMNAVPKVLAWLGYKTMSTARGFWESRWKELSQIHTWGCTMRSTIPM